MGIVRRDGWQEKKQAGADDMCGYPPPRRAVSAQKIRRGGSFQYRRIPGAARGEGARHVASAQKSQHNYPAKALRAVGRGVGQAEPLAPGLSTITIDRR